MFWLKSCPRCRGDLFQGRDHYGWYVSCLQCGHHFNEVEEGIFRYVYKGPTMDRPISTLSAGADTTRPKAFRKRDRLPYDGPLAPPVAVYP